MSTKRAIFKNKLNIQEKNNNVGPIKLKILLNLNNELKNIPNSSYIINTQTNINKKQKLNNRNYSLNIKSSNKNDSISKTFREHRTQKKKKIKSFINPIFFNSIKNQKKSKLIKSNKNKIINLLINKTPKDSLINLFSYNEKTKQKNHSIKFRTNNYINIGIESNEAEILLSNKKNFDLFINRYKDTVARSESTSCGDCKCLKSTDIFEKFENIKLKTKQLLEKYECLVNDLNMQLELEKKKNKMIKE